MTQLNRIFLGAFLALAVIAAGIPRAAAQTATEEATDTTYSENEILDKAKGFFGATTKGLAKAIEKVFADQGRPNAYIIGEEASGAIGIGVRYGEGTLNRKTGTARQVYWQGPTIGFDFGAEDGTELRALPAGLLGSLGSSPIEGSTPGISCRMCTRGTIERRPKTW